MGEDPGSRFTRQHFEWNSSDRITQNMWFSLGNPNIGLSFQNTARAMVSTEQALPFGGYSGLPCPRMAQSSEHLGWFYCFPRYHQAFAPAVSSFLLKDSLPVDPSGKCANGDKPFGDSDLSGMQKFLVFDRSGDQTSLIFGSGNNGLPIPCIPMARQKQVGITATGGETRGGETLSDDRDENEDVSMHSEMHEDTEELNALLYSDDESEYSSDNDDDEVTSTGHSPSTMTYHLYQNNDPLAESSEEVASSLWPPSKKRKLTYERHDVLPLTDTVAAENLVGNFNSSDDAISSSADSGDISRNKAIKRARIRETISILQSLVPGVKGKNPMVILDEAIEYLKSLKLKAEALGLSPL